MREVGALTSYLDVAQVVLYVFWIFFFLLVLYLNRESKREGYPLRGGKNGDQPVDLLLGVPKPKTYKLYHGGETHLPSSKNDDHRELAAESGRVEGDPIIPTENCLTHGIGAAAWTEREDVPDQLLDGSPKIRPMSTLPDSYYVADHSVDPRGLTVHTCDGVAVGTVEDIWLDCMEMMPRFYTVNLNSGGSRLVPVMLSTIRKNIRGPAEGSLMTRLTQRPRYIDIASLYEHQMQDVPQLANPGQITLREEDQISAYYGGGQLHASPDRENPLI
jgi:photosynthetic reaction center H subunit